MERRVRGILFADYVRMIRGHKHHDWSRELLPEDLAYLSIRVQPDGWYPMATFERLGNAILKVIAHDQLAAVQMWGRFQVDQLRAENPLLLAENDPVETLARFRVLRSTYFDFEALDVRMLVDGEAHVAISYGMGPRAEEAASYQAMGFFERLLEIAGARDIQASFTERSWAGDARTLLKLTWASQL